MYKTPNSTIDNDDDSGFDVFCTPSADISLMKMKSMNNLHDATFSIHKNGNNCGNLSRMKSMDNVGDTPINLVRLKRDFEVKRFNNAKIQSMNNLNNNKSNNMNGDYDTVDGFISRRHHSEDTTPPDSTYEINRLSSQTPTKRRVGNTKYVGGDSIDDNQRYQLMKMHSMGTITDVVNNNMKANERIWNGNSNTLGSGVYVNGKIKYDKRYIVPIRLDDQYPELCDNVKEDIMYDDVFKMPPSRHNVNVIIHNNNNNENKNIDSSQSNMNMMIPLRKEKSSSCIESMKNRGTNLYDRLR
jgi:hypothetical protein